jgi:hypothetical protein
MQEVFPYTYLFEGGGLQLVLIGSDEPLEPNLEKISAYARGGEERMKEVGLSSVYDLLASYLHGPEELVEYTRQIPPLTDDRPYLQYHDGNWNPDYNYLLQPPAQPLPLKFTDPAEETLFKAAVNRARTSRLYQFTGAPDPYLTLFLKTEQGKLLMEASPDHWTRVLTRSSMGHRNYLLSQPQTVMRELELARIAYLNQDGEQSISSLDRALELANDGAERQLVLYFKLLTRESKLSMDEKHLILKEADSLPSLSLAFKEAMQRRWQALRESKNPEGSS